VKLDASLTSTHRTGAVQDPGCGLLSRPLLRGMEGSSRLGLLLAALEAILERCSALAGSRVGPTVPVRPRSGRPAGVPGCLRSAA
jgi:hypothetical protein